MRWCTKNLKIKPFEKYVGEDPALLYIGIRADENREGYISTKPNLTPVYPFKEDGITREVYRFKGFWTQRSILQWRLFASLIKLYTSDLQVLLVA
jgi:hypothetical protein